MSNSATRGFFRRMLKYMKHNRRRAAIRPKQRVMQANHRKPIDPNAARWARLKQDCRGNPLPI